MSTFTTEDRVAAVKWEAMQKSFEEMTGVEGSWYATGFLNLRNAFISAWNDSLRWAATEHQAECKEERPVQHWLREWAKK